MKRTLLRPLALGVAALFVLAACGDDDEQVSAGSADTTAAGAAAGGTSPALEDTQWVLDLSSLDASYTGSAQGTLRLLEGQASGSTGCNNINGTYVLDGQSLTFSPLATTSMACEEPLMAIEKTVLAGLEATRSFVIDGDQLTLEGADGPVLLYTASGASSLVGSWAINGYLTPDKQAFTSVDATTQPSITFGDDGTVSGDASCNTFSGPYTTNGSELQVGPLASTKRLCEGIAQEQEDGILAALNSVASWQPTPQGIVLLNAEGMRAIELLPA